MKRIKLITGLVILIVIQSCGVISRTIVKMNHSNPFDYMGKQHNIMVTDLLTNYSYGTDPKEVEKKVKTNTGVSFLKIYPKERLIDLDVLNQIPTFEGSYASLDFDKHRDILFKIFSKADMHKAKLIADYMDACAKVIFTVDPKVSNAKLIAIENDFIFNRGGNFEEFYLTSAIFRYSLLRNLAIEDPRDDGVRLSRKWKIAIADGVGGLVGWFAGGPVGVLQGGAGASTIADLLLD